LSRRERWSKSPSEGRGQKGGEKSYFGQMKTGSSKVSKTGGKRKKQKAKERRKAPTGPKKKKKKKKSKKKNKKKKKHGGTASSDLVRERVRKKRNKKGPKEKSEEGKFTEEKDGHLFYRSDHKRKNVGKNGKPKKRKNICQMT